MNHVLVVDDESDIREPLERDSRRRGIRGHHSGHRSRGARSCCRMLPIDAVLLDIWLPDRDGLEVLQEIRTLDRSSGPEVIIISGHGTIETAVRATKLGAFDFLEKPLSIDRTLILLKNAVEARRLRSRQPGVSSANLHCTRRSPERAFRSKRCGSRFG